MFIKGYSNIARPLYALIGKKAKFQQGKEQEDVFRRIKELIVAEPVLVLLDLSKPFEVEANSLDYTIGGQLGQYDENGKLYPIAFFSKKLNSTQLNYLIYNKELLTIVEAFKEQRLYLSDITKPIKVYIDYKNLRYFTTTKELNRYQICQVEFLLEFNFEIHYKKGNENVCIDAFSRRLDYLKEYKAIGAIPPLLQAGTDRTLKYDPQLVDDPLDILKEYYTVFREECAIERFQSAPDLEREEEILDGVEEKDSKLQYRRKVYIYSTDIQREAIKEIYKSKLGGYKGIAKTIAQVRKYYNFLYILVRVKEVVKKYNIYNRSKTGQYKLYKLLQPLPIAQRPWSSITIDFITKLPTSKDSATSVIYNSILIVVNRLTKQVYFFLYKETQTIEQLVDIVYQNVASIYAQPEEQIIDRNTKFVSKFQQALIKRLGVNSKLSIVYYLQIDGQIERLN